MGNINENLRTLLCTEVLGTYEIIRIFSCLGGLTLHPYSDKPFSQLAYLDGQCQHECQYIGCFSRQVLKSPKYKQPNHRQHSKNIHKMYNPVCSVHFSLQCQGYDDIRKKGSCQQKHIDHEIG